jgi:phosphate transport system substrate-binding protein
MGSIRARALIASCVVTAAGIVAFAAPGAALAKETSTQCSGEGVGGQGSSLQKVAQETLWGPGFNSSTDKYACSGKQGTGGKPKIAYNPSGSGAGLRSWGAETKEAKELNFGPTNAFVGTDEPPNEGQYKEIVNEESTPTAKSLFTIPVAQESVTIIVHLPTGCVANSTAAHAEGRLALSDSTLQKIFAGTITTWAGVVGEAGNTLTPSTCDADTIHVIVRFDQSGTSHILKRYLNLINSATLSTSAGEKTWGELSEGSLNTVWPTAANVEKPGVKGGGELIKKLNETPSSIGYVNLAEARAPSADLTPPEGGPKTTKFWVMLENGSKGSGKSLKLTYADPAVNYDVATPANSNCAKTGYTNGKSAFPPPTLTGYWNEVTTSVPGAPAEVKEADYSLCGLTYDLAFSKYSLLESKGATKGEELTVNNYEHYITDKKGGQAALEGNDYSTLPKEVDSEAEAGAALIEF